ncbi:MAG: high-potential iron-sulfur protein [Pseudomonadota bacterium]
MDIPITRREAIKRGLKLTTSGGLLLGLAACGDDESGGSLVCADPGGMTSAQASVRRSLNYTEQSSDASQVCTGCDFFKAGAGSGNCGSCEIFSGGPVNPAGRCDSWSADA